MWLAAAAGWLYGLLDALAKGTVDILAVSGSEVLVTWAPYVLFGVAVFGALFGQSAYNSGALSLSLPVIDTMEPVTAVVIGATVFGESLASSPPLQAVQLAGGCSGRGRDRGPEPLLGCPDRDQNVARAPTWSRSPAPTSGSSRPGC
ncbi:MAG TPA: hypothetical protein VMV92_32100 [Streptosporangiaceae bacterium]|nr:hypothetical protein [Streptosporangiaceae bacterium]